jgi:hypothetical protein
MTSYCSTPAPGLGSCRLVESAVASYQFGPAAPRVAAAVDISADLRRRVGVPVRSASPLERAREQKQVSSKMQRQSRMKPQTTLLAFTEKIPFKLETMFSIKC